VQGTGYKVQACSCIDESTLKSNDKNQTKSEVKNSKSEGIQDELKKSEIINPEIRNTQTLELVT